MQLDNTRIAVRERTLLETLDLALHVVREFAWPWFLCSLLAIAPLAALNYFLIGWMGNVDPDADTGSARLLWNQTVLIFLEAPLASVFVVAYFGPAVFLEKRTFRQVVADVFRCFPQLFLCQFLMRGILPAWLLYIAVDRYQFDGFLEGFVLTVLAIYATGMRALRPYINEIILLEKNPLFSKKAGAITINRRSGDLHGPSSADLVVRWAGTAMIAVLLASLALITAAVALGILLSMWPVRVDLVEEDVTWQLSWFDVQVVYPACLWLVVAFMSVVRFLNYLDLRIRHEGWEVELLMRAEALRMETKLG
jgi:hypothetical protein